MLVGVGVYSCELRGLCTTCVPVQSFFSYHVRLSAEVNSSFTLYMVRGVTRAFLCGREDEMILRKNKKI